MKSKKSIVYISYYFPPVSTGSGPRNLRITKLLVRNGWSPSVITSSPSHCVPVDPELKRLIAPGVKVLRTGGTGSRAKSSTGTEVLRGKTGRIASVKSSLRSFVLRSLLQPDRFVTWLPKALMESVKEVFRTGAELVLSLGPPHSAHITGLLTSLITGRKWVAYFGDLWTRDGLQKWQELPYARLFWAELMEGVVVKSADGIVTTTDGSSDYFRSTYGEFCPPVFTLWNGLTEEELDGFSSNGVPAADGNDFVITYTGFFMGNQSPEYFLKGLQLFVKRNPEKNVRFRIVGDLGAYSNVPCEMGIDDHVEIVGRVPFSEVRKWQTTSHLLLLLLPPQPGNELKNPAKTAEYIASGRPILAVAPDGDLKKLLSNIKNGYWADHAPESVCKALETAYTDLISRINGKRDISLKLQGPLNMAEGVKQMTRFLDKIVSG